MSTRMLIAAATTALGALITLVNLRDGFAFSFPLLLGVLLLVDGALRFSMLGQDGKSARPQQARPLAAVGAQAAPESPNRATWHDAAEPPPSSATGWVATEDGQPTAPAPAGGAPPTAIPRRDDDSDEATPEMRIEPDDRDARPRLD